VADRLTRANPSMDIVVSAGAAGAYGFDGDAWFFVPALRVEPVNTAGAGDALLAGVIAARAAGAPVHAALVFAGVLAGLSVTSPHTIHPEADLDAVLRLAGEQGIALSGRIRSRVVP